MLAAELPVVSQAALEEIFRPHLVVRLSIHARALRVAVGREQVQDVLHLQLVVPRAVQESHVEQSPQPRVHVVLVVRALAEKVAAVVRHVIHAEEIVRHLPVSPIFVRIVQRSRRPRLSPFERPASVPVGMELEVAHRRSRPRLPVVVESVLCEPDAVLRSRQRGERPPHAARHSPQSAVEPEEVRAAPLRGLEVGEVRLVVPVAAHRCRPAVLRGNILREDLNEAPAEVGRIFRAWRFHHLQMVNLPSRNDVERKRPRVGLRARHGTPIYPYVVVALREPAHHDEFVFDEADARNATYHLARVAILRPFDFLRRDVVDDDFAAPCIENHGVRRIFPFRLHHFCLVQHLVVALDRYGQARSVAFCRASYAVHGQRLIR